ncbi:small heat shock protein [Sistotremastrum niveocremeum HHB9708]|uniref:Small heat shock protein n=2 Tax=Sistotremastraceae TaxID=3402574 RepID=A0A164XYC2_9AGAM|nr:small heat shock protein [Sistotremastrum niveocremeum HHB9708]KZT40729.1 HSP20-like chaperone [Sistotremastrum suecicum HHB10207 ss-3]
MSLSRFYYDPFFTVDDFHRLFDEAFETRSPSSNRNTVDNRRTSSSLIPRMDIHENPEANTVTASFELPGLKKEDVNIDLANSRLTISGKSERSTEHNEEGYAVKERNFGKFSRSIQLPKGIQPQDIGAKMEDGVLTVTFPKTGPEQAPARIAIN